jgi:hypothetical protein
MPEGTHVGDRVVMAGYGAADADERSGAGTKRWAYGNIDSNNGDELEIVGDNAATCLGDSGGPITEWDGNAWVLVGVIVGGSGECSPDSTTYAALPTEQSAFIEANLSLQSVSFD